MAEAIGGDDTRKTLPPSGKVENVCRQWLVHEDGAFAYKLQNEEIDHHYDKNRFHRRTVRGDIPVAKVAQTEEEQKQQQERFQQLQALKAQAEEDEKVAQKVMVDLMREEQSEQQIQQIHDEEVAKQFQEKEKRRYERYLEKKKEKQLQKEREKIEKNLEQQSQEARLLLNRTEEAESNAGLSQAVGGLNLSDETNSPVARVTPAGRIEDEGDFSDFMMVLPEHVDDQQKKILQELQDEEIARLIQEQEHKRTKAEVDRNKLRDIEEQDARLAKIIHEQEKLKSKKSKQRRQQREEARRQQEMQQIGDSTNPTPPLSPDQQSDTPEHHRLRRDSFMQSLANGPARSSETDQRSPPPQQSQSSRQNSRTPRQNSENLTSSSISRRDSREHSSISPQSSRQTPQENRRPSSKSSRKNSSDNTPLPPLPVGRARLPTPDELQYNDVKEVEKWLAGSQNGSNISSERTSRGHSHSDRSHFSDPMLPSPSPPGSYHSEEELSFRLQGSMEHSPEPLYAVSNPLVGTTNPVPFNIATAIDPTYHRRQHEIDLDETERKVPIPILSQSLPVAGDTTRSTISREDSFEEEGPVMSPWQPVQGQRRSTVEKGRKSKKQSTNGRKGSCKQQ